MFLPLFLFLSFLLNAQPSTPNPYPPSPNPDVEVWGTYEVALRPTFKVKNPFTDVIVSAVFTDPDGNTHQREGFCDAQDGSVFKVRIMPEKPGLYKYTASLKSGTRTKMVDGSFTAIASNLKGPLQLDPEHPTHFIYKGSSDHYFWNSTTTYWLLGWRDEKQIHDNIERLAGLGINRLRVAIAGRSHGGIRWNEATVVECDEFSFMLNPWVAKNPKSLDNPGFDVSRFNVNHWQRLDRVIEHARKRGIIISVIFYVDGLDHATDPFKKENMGNQYEQMYYAYAAARYRSYSNIMWDIANEYHLFRTPEWADKMGSYLRTKDPDHLISVHGNADFPFRKSHWVDVIMYQAWDECGGYPFIMESRKKQAETGRPLPTINEEYGYEGHYAVWGCGPTTAKERPDGRSGLNRSQLAWEICMAGAYQTTGETAEYGTGAGENTGGGWINGRGNGKMTMLNYYRIMKDCFEKTRWWEMEPRNDLISYGNLLLANPGKEYLIYTRVQHCRLQLGPNEKYSVTMIDPRTGETTKLPDADSNADMNAWQYRRNLEKPTVFILKRI
jgi:hypothetical protein